ncbi:hypothetical protein PV326_000193 [Microctonus aethiopoides]|nr:hypothetical protein PV326_000193 [Microctonus aethiopoides]
MENEKKKNDESVLETPPPPPTPPSSPAAAAAAASRRLRVVFRMKGEHWGLMSPGRRANGPVNCLIAYSMKRRRPPAGPGFCLELVKSHPAMSE